MLNIKSKCFVGFFITFINLHCSYASEFREFVSGNDYRALENELEFGKEHILGSQTIRFVDALGRILPGVGILFSLSRDNVAATSPLDAEIRFMASMRSDSRGEVRIPYGEEGVVVRLNEKLYKHKVVEIYSNNISKLGYNNSVPISRSVVEIILEKLSEPVPIYKSTRRTNVEWDVFAFEVVKPIVLPNSENFKEPLDNIDLSDVIFRVKQIIKGHNCPSTVDASLGGRRTSRSCWSVTIEGKNGWNVCYVPSLERLGRKEEYLAVEDGYVPELVLDDVRFSSKVFTRMLEGYLYLYNKEGNKYGLIEIVLDEDEYYYENQKFYRLYLSYSSRVQAVQVDSLSLMPE
jgi:hypothetical protein